MAGWTPETAAWNVDLDHVTTGVSAGYYNEFTCHFGKSTGNPLSGAACGRTIVQNTYMNWTGYGYGPMVGPVDVSTSCGLPGDSGGPYVDGSTIIGFASAGSTTGSVCPANPVSYFQEAPTAAGTLGGLTIATTF
jgi:hypothetical protein